MLGAKVHAIRDMVDRRGFGGVIKTALQSLRGMATEIRDPGVDLRYADTVVLVQPIWTMAITPPMRSWLREHKAALAGKRVGLLVSSHGTPAALLKARYGWEFGGGLAAFGAVPSFVGPAKRRSAIERFARELGVRGA